MNIASSIPADIIRHIAEASPVAEVIASRGVTLRKTGATFTGLCPFHSEKTPSFVVTPARGRFKCFGCGAGGDVFAFEMMLAGIGFPAAALSLAQRAGITVEGAERSSEVPYPRRIVPAKPAPEPARRPLVLPADLTRGTRTDLQRVADQRGLSLAGVMLARDCGLLWFGRSCGFPAWIVTDAERVNAQSRRMDGKTFPAFKELSARKAHTLGGSRAGWPVGTREATDKPFVVVVEGGPDLLAAHHFIVAEGREDDTAAVAMLGAANRIPEEALLLLANKRMRLFPHTDPAGAASAVRWCDQLERVGCTVDAFGLDGLRRGDGGAVGDLNDLAHVDADCFEAEREELSEVLPR